MHRFISTGLVIIALTLSTSVFAADTKGTVNAAEPTAKARLDINTATEDQLKALPGVGEENARKIIAGRPYNFNEELKHKKVITTDLFEKINKLIRSKC